MDSLAPDALVAVLLLVSSALPADRAKESVHMLPSPSCSMPLSSRAPTRGAQSLLAGCPSPAAGSLAVTLHRVSVDAVLGHTRGKF